MEQTTMSLFSEEEIEQLAPFDDSIQYEFITEPAQVQHVIDTLWSAPILGFDVEFNHKNIWYAKQLLWQLSDGEHTFVGTTQTVPLKLLKPLLETHTLIAHNAVTEFKACYLHGVEPRHFIDTMLALQVARAGLLDKDASRTIGLAAAAKHYLNIVMPKKVRDEFLGHDGKHFTRQQKEYAAKDVIPLIPLWSAIRAELQAKEVYEVALFEFSLVPVFGKLELSGMHANVKPWRAYLGELEKLHTNLWQECEPALIEGYNRWLREQEWKRIKGKRHKATDYVAPDTMQGILMHVDVAVIKKFSPETMLRCYAGYGIDLESSDKEALQSALEDGLPEEVRPLLEKMVELSAHTKMLSTYGESVLKKMSPDGTLWANLWQLGAAATGRSSSGGEEGMNFQNIPARGEIGGKFRTFFVAPKGTKLIIADYSAFEPRIAAHLSQDQIMLKALREGLDMHSLAAASIFNLSYELFEEKGKYSRETGEYKNKKAVMPNGLTIKFMRDEVSKTAGLAANYGGGIYTLYAKLKGPLRPILAKQHFEGDEKKVTQKVLLDECKRILEGYKATYKGLFGMMDRQGHHALTQGFTKSIIGRKRFYWPTEFENNDHTKGYVWLTRIQKQKRAKQKIGKIIDGKTYTQKDFEDAMRAEQEGIRRAAFNAPIQGSAADIMKRAMYYIDLAFIERDWWRLNGPEGKHVGTTGPGACLEMQVHDEIIADADTSIAEEVAKVIEECMLRAEQELIPSVPAKATCSIGTRWDEK